MPGVSEDLMYGWLVRFYLVIWKGAHKGHKIRPNGPGSHPKPDNGI